MNETTPATDRPTLTTDERRAILAEYDSSARGDPRRGALLRQHGVCEYLRDGEPRKGNVSQIFQRLCVNSQNSQPYARI